jgi:DNA-binding XRE family transcriptional regulator
VSFVRYARSAWEFDDGNFVSWLIHVHRGGEMSYASGVLMKAEHEARLTGSSSDHKNTSPYTEPVLPTADAATLTHRHCLAFGHNLRRARADRDLTLEDVAVMSGVPEDHVVTIEAGKCNLRLESMTALAGAVGCELWTLLALSDTDAQ